jgi:glycosyltransferase involved in cell wall biosynthesis
VLRTVTPVDSTRPRELSETSAGAGPAFGSFIDDPLAHPLVRPEHRLTRQASVLAIVPHYKCERWLGDCLDSLSRQTSPLAGIVVVDDGSRKPPVAIVRSFPSVTLLSSNENVGPYRISQEVIAQTGYDAYLFQDADDWSAPSRLALLLAEAERTGAEVVGCQAYRLISDEGEVVPLTFPLDVNASLDVSPTSHAVMHPSSLVSRDLVMRIGGYATGLRFGADTEFESRAGHVARIVNIPQFEYVVRNRANSLTSSKETGLRSAKRQTQTRLWMERANENASRVAAGKEPILTPLAVAEPLPLTYIVGPKLRSAGGGNWPA